MLLLVFADGHVRRLVEENVGRHQHGVGVKAEPGVLPLFPGLFLELRHPVEPAERRQTAQKPGQLGMRADSALVEDDAALGIDAGGYIGGGHLARRLAQLVGPHPEVFTDLDLSDGVVAEPEHVGGPIRGDVDLLRGVQHERRPRRHAPVADVP